MPGHRLKLFAQVGASSFRYGHMQRKIINRCNHVSSLTLTMVEDVVRHWLSAVKDYSFGISPSANVFLALALSQEFGRSLIHEDVWYI